MTNKLSKSTPRFLIKHVGNMGDMIFFVPPVLETLKKKFPNCHITFVTAWGFKEVKRRWPTFTKREYWGNRNQSGFCIALVMTNPNIDRLVHWHDTSLSLDKNICMEEGQRFETWNKAYYNEQKMSGQYDGVYELDFGLKTEDDPLTRMYEAAGLPEETYSNYKIYLTAEDMRVAGEVINGLPHPRIVLLEGLEGTTTRGWDPAKVRRLEDEIKKTYGALPLWFGGKHVREYEGRPLTLRENIATLTYCDAAIGVMSGPLHFAAAVSLPTITLFGDQPLHRAAPAYFLNQYIADPAKRHRTILGPTGPYMRFLKDGTTFVNLTPAEQAAQGYRSWQDPGRQSTKSCVAVITVDEVMAVLKEMLGGMQKEAVVR